MLLPEPKPEAQERPVNGATSASAALTEGADPDPDQYLWGV
jgi:hypothetical protein